MTTKTTKVQRKAAFLRKVDVVEAFGGVERQVALALDITAQAVSNWGEWVPRKHLLDLLEIRPSLQGKIKRQKV